MNADGVYGYRPWMQNVPAANPQPNDYEAAVTKAALAPTMGMDEEAIRQIRPLLNINPFPNRFGYRTEALGIRDIARVDSLYERIDYTGRQSGYQGSSYPSLNQF